MTTLSAKMLERKTDDYEIRAVVVPDHAIPGLNKEAYGVFNRLTNVREGIFDSLAFAAAGVQSAQMTLAHVIKEIEEKTAAQSVPSFDMPRVQ